MVIIALSVLTQPIIQPGQVAMHRQHPGLHGQTLFKGQNRARGLIQSSEDCAQLKMGCGIVMLQSDGTKRKFH